MVYVDVFGPKTLRYSDGGMSMERDLPFRPRMYGTFDIKTKYEIIYMEDNIASLYDNNNILCDIRVDHLYSQNNESVMDDGDLNYIKECILSSFEDIVNVDNFDYQVYLTEILVNINYPIEIEEFDVRYVEEFAPRLYDLGYEVNRQFYMGKKGRMTRHSPLVKKGYASKIQISISK
jgi:hypothetical protein